MNDNYYVDNKKFFEHMSIYIAESKKAQKEKQKNPMVSDYIAECFLKIATHLAYKSNFINYYFRDELISDGVENCILYAHNFNPSKSNNPFSYFTTISYYAFVRRIKKEKKQLYLKYKMIEKSGITEQLGIQNDEDNSTIQKQYVDYLSNYEQYGEMGNKKPKKVKEKKKNLQNFI